MRIIKHSVAHNELLGVFPDQHHPRDHYHERDVGYTAFSGVSLPVGTGTLTSVTITAAAPTAGVGSFALFVNVTDPEFSTTLRIGFVTSTNVALSSAFNMTVMRGTGGAGNFTFDHIQGSGVISVSLPIGGVQKIHLVGHMRLSTAQNVPLTVELRGGQATAAAATISGAFIFIPRLSRLQT
jgi:hypothetical protein